MLFAPPPSLKTIHKNNPPTLLKQLSLDPMPAVSCHWHRRWFQSLNTPYLFLAFPVLSAAVTWLGRSRLCYRSSGHRIN